MRAFNETNKAIFLEGESLTLNVCQRPEYVSVLITALHSVPYVMYCIRHIQNSGIQRSVFSGIWQHIQRYSALLRHIHASRDIFKAYSGLFKHIQHPV